MMECSSCGREMSPGDEVYLECQGMGNTSGTDGPVPEEVRRMGWSWGGFALTWIWGVGNGVWIALLGLIPLVNIAVAIWLGVSGHAMAWRNRRFEGIGEFKTTMRTWNNGGLALFLAGILFYGGVVAPRSFGVFNRARDKAVQTSCLSNMKQIALGVRAFAQDHDETLPSSTTWDTEAHPYARQDSVFMCPGGAGYAMNPAVSDAALADITEPSETVLVYECDENGKQLCAHDGGMNVAYVDGHVKWDREAALAELVWDP